VPALITWWQLDVGELSPKAHNDTVLAVCADLLRRLGEPQRRYHTTRHLVEVFWALEDLEQAAAITTRDAALGRLAGWFHDAVYDPGAGAGENERASADLAVRELTSLGLHRGDVQAVNDLVLATESHQLARSGLPAAFQDADLWILSAAADRYGEYTAQVREEYAAVPDDAFRAGRAAILRPLLERESVYTTAFARETWEESARANLARELEILTA
jgi:predicted metal-dependent HD superfamily phosphohydrolase